MNYMHKMDYSWTYGFCFITVLQNIGFALNHIKL